MILDIIIVLIIALSTYLAYKKGFIKLAIKLVALIISIVITVVLYNPISNLVINVTGIDETIENHIYEKVMEKMNNNEQDENQSYLGITVAQAQEGMLPTAARELAISIVKLGVFLVLLIGTKIIIGLINALGDLISGFPILKQFNKLGGVLYGIIRALFVILVLLTIAKFIIQINPDNKINEQIQKSYVTKLMYENNIINVFFEQK